MSNKTKVAIAVCAYSAFMYGLGFIAGHDIGYNSNYMSNYLRGFSLGYDFGSKKEEKEDK